tara:strand:- start:229 stop:801 length:573 start_codon:yes stop_codon:yes gene_type:complete
MTTKDKDINKPAFTVIEGGISIDTKHNHIRTEKDHPNKGNAGSGKTRNEYGCTEKEEKFSQLLAVGDKPMVECYKEVYDVKTTNMNSMYRMANTVWSRDHVKSRVKELKGVVKKDARLDAVQTMNFIIDRLWIEAKDSANRASERLKAIELLGKLEHIGAFRERSEIITQEASTPDAIKARIEELLHKAS